MRIAADEDGNASRITHLAVVSQFAHLPFLISRLRHIRLCVVPSMARIEIAMWIVKTCSRSAVYVYRAGSLILILGPIVILRTPTDVFPEINIPVVSIVWNYSGLSSEDMGNRITSVTERALTTLRRRHRAYRVAIAERHRGRKGVFAAARQHRQSDRAGDRDFADAACGSCLPGPRLRWYLLQRIHRPDFAVGTFRPRSVRAAVVRFGSELHPHAVDHRAGSGDSLSLRRQAAAGAGRS